MRVERPVLRREQRAAAVGRCAGPALPHLVGPEPVATQAGLALGRHRRLQPVVASLVEGEGRDPRLPQVNVDPRGFTQRRREGLIQVARAHGQAEGIVGAGLDLGGEHPGRRWGSRARLGPRLEDRDRETPERGGAGTRGAHDTPADHHDVIRLHGHTLAST